MHSRLNDLNSRQITHLDIDGVVRQRHLGQAEGAGVGVAGGTDDLEGREHGEGDVGWLRAEAHVDVDEGGGVAGEPAGLDSDGAAVYGPFGAVGGGGHAAAWEG